MKEEKTPTQPLLPSQSNFKVYSYRYVIMGLFLIMAFAVQTAISMTVPLTLLISGAYQLPVWLVNSMPLVSGCCFSFIGMLLSSHYFDNVGIKPGVRIGAAILLASLWIFTFCDVSYWFIFAAQNILYLATPFFANTTQTVSSIWFAPEERLKATTLMTAVLTFGYGFGALIPRWFIADGVSGAEAIARIKFMNLIIASIFTVAAIPAVIFIRSKPPTPPCEAVSVERMGLFKSIMEILKNKNSFLFLISAGTRLALPNAFQFAIQVIVAPFGFDSDDVGLIFIWVNLLSLPFYYLAVVAFNHIKSYKKTIILFNILMAVLVCGLFPIFLTRNVWVIGIYLILLCGASNAPYGLALEYMAELSFPAGETAAGGMLVLFYFQINSGTAFLTDSIISNEQISQSFLACAILGGISILGVILNSFVKEDLRRTNFFSETEQIENLDDSNGNEEKVVISTLVI